MYNTLMNNNVIAIVYYMHMHDDSSVFIFLLA